VGGGGKRREEAGRGGKNSQLATSLQPYRRRQNPAFLAKPAKLRHKSPHSESHISLDKPH
jgi:hypothetical protein